MCFSPGPRYIDVAGLPSRHTEGLSLDKSGRSQVLSGILRARLDTIRYTPVARSSIFELRLCVRARELVAERLVAERCSLGRYWQSKAGRPYDKIVVHLLLYVS